MVKVIRTKVFYCGVAFFFALGGARIQADTRSTAEGAALQMIFFGIDGYQQSHGGQAPTNWAQVSEFRDLTEIDRGFPVSQNYAFIRSDRINLPDAERGEVFLIRLSPVTNAMNPEGGRYIISLAAGVPKLNWLSETNVQKMLSAAGVSELPQPEPWVPKTNATVILPPTNTSPAIVPQADTSVIPPPDRIEAPPHTNEMPTPVSASAQPTPESPSSVRSLLIALTVILVLVAVFAFLRFKK